MYDIIDFSECVNTYVMWIYYGSWSRIFNNQEDESLSKIGFSTEKVYNYESSNPLLIFT